MKLLSKMVTSLIMVDFDDLYMFSHFSTKIRQNKIGLILLFPRTLSPPFYDRGFDVTLIFKYNINSIHHFWRKILLKENKNYGFVFTWHGFFACTVTRKTAHFIEPWK